MKPTKLNRGTSDDPKLKKQTHTRARVRDKTLNEQ